ncbi:MAG: VCBS repeat-containing protein [Pirellulaceae bacterium]
MSIRTGRWRVLFVIEAMECRRAMTSASFARIESELSFDGSRVQAGGLAMADFDGDGDVDLLTAMSTTEFWVDRLAMFANDGAGSFEFHSWVGSQGDVRPEDGSFSIPFVTGDVDLDGDIDVISIDLNDSLHLHLNDGHGLFERQVVLDLLESGTLDSASKTQLVDFDQDGDLDIFVSDLRGNLTWVENVANGEFVNRALPRLPNVESVDQVLAFDFRHDGQIDIIYRETSPTFRLVLRENQGTNSFRPYVARRTSRKLHRR